jgi:CubicO group peptidase (beta-lactamase class C family)
VSEHGRSVVRFLWRVLVVLASITTAACRATDPAAARRGGSPPQPVRNAETLFDAVDSVVVRAICDSAFPAAQLSIGTKDSILHSRCFGRYTYEQDSRPVTPSTLFDLASLTKVVATTSAVMKLVEDGRLKLDDPVGNFIPAFTRGEKQAVTLRHLLTHRSGLPPFRRFYDFCLDAVAALDSVYATPLVARPGDTTIYSDLGMIVLGKVVEHAAGMPLDAYFDREFLRPLRMGSTMFNPPAGVRFSVAPTELDTTWRHGLVWGVVHDENAAFLGGVSGHAGLFSNAEDLSKFVQMLLGGGASRGVRLLRPETVKLFLSPVAGADRLLGWDRKSPQGSSAGELFSARSFGHTGFTGTSIWVDPERDLFVIFLTNRVYPTRANMRISAVRRELHDAVARAVDRSVGK